MKILVIKRDKIGDLLLTTPMLHRLRRALPAATIHLLATDYNAWVVAGNPDVDRVLVYPRVRVGRRIRPGALARQLWLAVTLRRQRYDAAIAAGGEESRRAIAWLLHAGAARSIGYCARDPRCRKLTDALPPPETGHESERLMALLAPLGVAAPARPVEPRYEPPAEWRDYAAAWLAERGLARGGYAVIGLGTRRAKKQPTTEQIVRWTARLKQSHGLDTVFMWTPGGGNEPLYPGDDEVAEPVLARRLPWLHPFRGPLLPAIGLVWQARTSIFPDSGLMHFAAASPGGVLGLFADVTVSPSPAQWGPLGPRAAHLAAPAAVSELDDEAVFAALAPRLAADPA